MFAIIIIVARLCRVVLSMLGHTGWFDYFKIFLLPRLKCQNYFLLGSKLFWSLDQTGQVENYDFVAGK